MKKKKIILVSVIAVLLILVLVIALITHHSAPQQADEQATYEDDTPTDFKVTIKDDSTFKPEGYIPKTRDNYIHIESIPGDGYYEQIVNKSPLDITNADKDCEDMITKLSSEISQLYQYDTAETILIYRTDTASTYWIKFNDDHWRLKYFYDSKKITADGQMKDCVAAYENDFDLIYQENTRQFHDISHELVISLANKIADHYQYDSCINISKEWAWDEDERNDHNLIIYTLQFQNSKYTDIWVFTYAHDNFIEAHRDITGI